MAAYSSKFAFEIWSPSGVLLADYSGRAMSKHITITRNRPETIDFELNLDEFESYCRSNNQDPNLLLRTGINEIRVRRNGNYLCGGQIVYVKYGVNVHTQRIVIKATGFLNLFKDRYLPVQRTFTATDGSVIASTIIAEAQNGTNVITNNSFEIDLSGWVSSNATITRDTSTSYTGSASMSVVLNSNTSTVKYSATLRNGDIYQGGCFIKGAAGQVISLALITDSTVLDYSTTKSITLNGGWQFISTGILVIAGSTLTQVSLTLSTTNATGASFNIDTTTIECGDTVNSVTIGNATVGNYGVTTGNLATVGNHDRSYKRTNIKDALIALSEVQVAPLDFEFTPSKVFNTYSSIGSNRPEIVFNYPGNIINLDYTDDATTLGNQVIGIGSGNGNQSQTIYVGNDNNSQLNYGLKQQIFNSSATDNSDNGLTDGTLTEVARLANPVRLPSITVDGNVAPFVDDYKVGDRVNIQVIGYASLSSINAMYRIEMIDLMIDDDDNESVSLTVSA